MPNAKQITLESGVPLQLWNFMLYVMLYTQYLCRCTTSNLQSFQFQNEIKFLNWLKSAVILNWSGNEFHSTGAA